MATLRNILCVAAACAALGCGSGSGKGDRGAKTTGAEAGVASAPKPVEDDEPTPGGPTYAINRLDNRRFVIADDVLIQIAVELAAGEFTLEQQSDSVGLAGIAPGSVLAQLGFVDGDLLASANDVALTDAAALHRAYASVRTSGEVDVSFDRSGKKLRRRYVLHRSLDSDLRAHVKVWNTDAPSAGEDADLRLLEALRTGIKRLGEDEREIDRVVLKTLAETEGLLARAFVRPAFSRKRGVYYSIDSSVYAALGITRYDVIQAVNDRDVSTDSGLQREIRGLAGSAKFTISIVRLREPMILRYKVVTDLVMDADLDRALVDWREAQAAREELGRPYKDPSYRPHVTLPSAGPAAPMDGVTELDSGTFEITGELLDKVGKDQSSMGRTARMVPSIKNGRFDGIKLYAIRPSSVWHAIGLKNGDTIRSVGDVDLTEFDKIRLVYDHIKSRNTVVVDIRRRGRDMTIHYRIKR